MMMQLHNLVLLFALTTPLLAQVPKPPSPTAPLKAPLVPATLPTVETLLTWLQSTDSRVRAKAQAQLPDALAWPGEKTFETRDKQWGRQLYGKPANPAHDYEWLYRRILILLAHHGAKAQTAVPLLLDWRGAGPSEGAPPVPGLPSTGDEIVRDNTALKLPPPPRRSGTALYALTFIAPDDPRVIDVLLAEWQGANNEAARALNRLGARDSILKGLRRRPADYLGLDAVALLAKFGPKARDFVPQIVPYLGEESDESARIAMLTLSKIGVTTTEIEAALVEKLKDEDPVLQSSAFYGLVRFARNKPRLPAPEALKTLDNWKTAAPMNLARAFVTLSQTPPTTEALTIYTRVARQTLPDYFADQFWSLVEKSGPGQHAPLVQALIERNRASLAALRPGDRAALSPLQQALSHPKWEVKVAALAGLAKLGETAKSLRPAMEKVFIASINDPQALSHRPRLLESARQLQMESAVRPALMAWLGDNLKRLQTINNPTDDDYAYHASLLQTLTQSGKPNAAERGALEMHVYQALAMDNIAVFIQATHLARLVKPPVAPLLTRLEEVLSEKFDGLSEIQGAQGQVRSIEARQAALRLVQTLGSEARVLVPRLKEIAESRDQFWQRSAEAAQNALVIVTANTDNTPSNATDNAPAITPNGPVTGNIS
jgi:HEAT repeat protein